MWAFVSVVAASSVLAGVGCGGACNDIGCNDQVVRVDAGELPTNLLPFDLTACVDGLCHDIPYVVSEQNSPMVPVGVDVPTTGLEEGDVVSVTLSVSVHATGDVLLEASGTATAVRYRASNSCGPYCTNASLKLDRASGLLVGPEQSD